MAQITLTIPDNHVQRVIDALCAQAKVPATAANAKTQIANYVKAVVIRYEAQASALSNDIAVT